MQQQPDPAVVGWLDAQPAESIWISGITLFEALYGLAWLPDGQREATLRARFEDPIRVDLANRIAVPDVRAAAVPTTLAPERRRSGRPVDMRDNLIAGIAIAQGATVATRNTRLFEDIPIPIINPWGKAIPAG